MVYITDVSVAGGSLFPEGESVEAVVQLGGTCCGNEVYPGPFTLYAPLPSQVGIHDSEWLTVVPCPAEILIAVAPTYAVVKVDRIQRKLPFFNQDIYGTLYVLKNTTIEFKAIPQPAGAQWPSGKPKWSGAASGVGETAEVTFTEIGEKSVSVECGNTVTVKVVVGDLVVDFSRPELRPGVGAERKEKVRVTATRSMAADTAVTISLESTNTKRATLSHDSITIPANQIKAVLSVQVTGVAESEGNRDTQMVAKHNGKEVGQIPLTTTKPARFTVVESATSGAWTVAADNDKKVVWQTRVQLTIVDKWDTRLSAAYDGAKIQERVKNPGELDFSGLIGLDNNDPNPWSTISAGTAIDVVAGHAEFGTAAVAQAVAAGTTVYPKDFAGSGVPNPVVAGGYELKFSVEGEELKGRLKRTRTIKDNKETVKNELAD